MKLRRGGVTFRPLSSRTFYFPQRVAPIQGYRTTTKLVGRTPGNGVGRRRIRWMFTEPSLTRSEAGRKGRKNNGTQTQNKNHLGYLSLEPVERWRVLQEAKWIPYFQPEVGYSSKTCGHKNVLADTYIGTRSCRLQRSSVSVLGLTAFSEPGKPSVL